ncbi:MAG: hypothetical protein LBF83_10565 [Spirochaetaceae bacterium]|nr:hypothetical protein [Spirochaetaceae bacterium]
MPTIQLSVTDDLIDICYDKVFNVVFTKESPESQGALRDCLRDHWLHNEPPRRRGANKFAAGYLVSVALFTRFVPIANWIKRFALDPSTRSVESSTTSFLLMLQIRTAAEAQTSLRRGSKTLQTE